MHNFHLHEVVDRDSETQLQVGEKLNNLNNDRLINSLFSLWWRSAQRVHMREINVATLV